MKAGLTTAMRKCLDYVTAYIGLHGFSPSYEEIQHHMGLKSKSGVCRMIDSLEARGHLVRLPGHKRSLALKTGPEGVPSGHVVIPLKPPRELWAAMGDAQTQFQGRPVHHDLMSEAIFTAITSWALTQKGERP